MIELMIGPRMGLWIGLRVEHGNKRRIRIWIGIQRPTGTVGEHGRTTSTPGSGCMPVVRSQRPGGFRMYQILAGPKPRAE